MNTDWCLLLRPLGITTKRQEVTRVGTWTLAEQAGLGCPGHGQGRNMCWHTQMEFQVSALRENLLGLLKEMKRT